MEKERKRAEQQGVVKKSKARKQPYVPQQSCSTALSTTRSGGGESTMEDDTTAHAGAAPAPSPAVAPAPRSSLQAPRTTPSPPTTAATPTKAAVTYKNAPGPRGMAPASGLPLIPSFDEYCETVASLSPEASASPTGTASPPSHSAPTPTETRETFNYAPGPQDMTTASGLPLIPCFDEYCESVASLSPEASASSIGTALPPPLLL